jgi:hypothetical protein
MSCASNPSAPKATDIVAAHISVKMAGNLPV